VLQAGDWAAQETKVLIGPGLQVRWHIPHAGSYFTYTWPRLTFISSPRRTHMRILPTANGNPRIFIEKVKDERRLRGEVARLYATGANELTR